MRVTARYFAVLREQRGCSHEDLDLPAGTTAAGAYRILFTGELPVAFAVNQVAVAGATALIEGDEVAFLPPVGGG